MRNSYLKSACVAVALAFLAATTALAVPKSFTIESQDASRALLEFGRQSELQILFASEKVKGITTNAVHGDFEPIEALKKLLKGTHLVVSEKAGGVLVVGLPAAHSASSRDTATEDRLIPASDGIRVAQVEQSSIKGAAVQSSGGDFTPNKDSTKLEEIVVTAQKRAERLQDVPISIAALTSAQMQASGVKDLSEIAALTPGVELDSISNYAPNLFNIAIRGVNSLAGASTTGVYIDDVPIQSRVTVFSLIGQPLPMTFDLNRVEVARGPQGTLFGSGAEGGTMRFISNEPGMHDWEGLAHSEVSSTKSGALSYEAGVAGGGGLVENVVGVRASAWFRHDGGYVDHIDPFNGATVESNSNRSTSKNARLAFAIVPSEDIRISPSVFYQSKAVHDIGTFYESLSNPSNDDFKNARLLRQPYNDTFYLPSLKIEADLGFAELTSVTAYFHREATSIYDFTNEACNFVAPYIPGAAHTDCGNLTQPENPTSYDQVSVSPGTKRQAGTSQELRLASKDPSSKLKWVAGVFYSDSNQFDSQNLISAYLFPADPTSTQSQKLHDAQYAAFGQIDYTVAEHVTVTAGIRASHVSYDSLVSLGGWGAVGEPPTLTATSSETPVTPKFGISYQANPNNLYYLTIAKGYRVGGVNIPPAGNACGNAVIPTTYGSDNVWSYEIGAKNAFLGGRLQTQSSAFHISWQKIQQPVIVGSCGGEYVTNTGSAAVNGFDLAAQALLSDNMRLEGSVSYIDAYYTKTFAYDAFGQVLVVVNKNDVVGSVPQVPSPWSLTAAAEYSRTFIGDTKWTFRLEDIFHSRNNGPFTNYDPASLNYSPDIPPNPNTNLLQFRTTAEFGKTELAFFVNNLLDSHPLLGRSQELPAQPQYYDSTFRPRTIGVGISQRF